MVLVYWLQPTIVNQPCGIALPVSPSSATTPDQVNLVVSDPQITPVAAYVNVVYMTDSISTVTNVIVANYAKKLAATMGSKKINVMFTGYDPQLSSLIVNAIALKGAP